jgi:hypothetical protein
MYLDLSILSFCHTRKNGYLSSSSGNTQVLCRADMYHKKPFLELRAQGRLRSRCYVGLDSVKLFTKTSMP